MIQKIKKFVLSVLNKVSDFYMAYNRAVLCFGLAICLAVSALIVGVRINTFNISDGVATRTVRLMSDDVNEAVRYAMLGSKGYTVLKTSKKNGVTDVTISYEFPVKITVGSESTTVVTAKSTVKNILNLAGYDVDGYDLTEPSADTVIDGPCTIKYSDVEFVKGSYTETIPCSLETVYDVNKVKGENSVVQGKDGKKQVYYTSKTVNGIAVKTTVNNVVVLSEAVSGRQIIGTAAPKPIAVTTSEQVSSVSTLKPDTAIAIDAKGAPVNYTKKLTVQATGYTYTGRRCATGVAPQPGYIAVNPNVIPYGTKMYIKSKDGAYTYGYAVAADTGGFAYSRPNNVDLFFSSRSAAIAFGRRDVEIYFIG